MLTGVPDGMGAYLLDASTIRVIFQSESYGPMYGLETYPFAVASTGATFTGSHVHYIDYDRDLMVDFMSRSGSAESMVKGSGELIQEAYNLLGNKVAARNTDASVTTGCTGAHFSNTDPSGCALWEDIMADPAPGQGVDWLMQSLCSAHLEEAEQWGTGIGLVDSLFLTNEEWTDFVDGSDYTGIPAHAIDLATKTAYAVGVFTLGGFEKIVEINCGHADYVCFSPSGYNGNFGVDGEDTTNIKSGTTPDGNAYVFPKDVVPTRIYIGLKGYAADGTADTTGYLARNGLAYGQLYGFATDITTTTGGLFRDDWSVVTTRTCGDTVSGYFAPIDWMWDGTVKQFKEDGSWAFQHLTADGDPFWNSGGRQVAGKKTEHNSPDPYGGFRYIQTSTAGHFGVIDYTGVTALLDAVAGTTSFPTKIPADYINIEGEVDISARIELNGKGKYANGGDATQNYDSDQAVGAGKVTFEDIDGFEWVSAAGTSDGYVIIQEDSGNDYGERTFIAELTIGTPLTYYLIALSGGDKSTRTSNGVGVPATASAYPNTHEFSGVIDLSGMLAKDMTGAYKATAGDGKSRLDANKDVGINDKYIAMGLQAHDHSGGVIATYKGDRGGAIYVYQPDIPAPSLAPTPSPIAVVGSASMVKLSAIASALVAFAAFAMAL